MYTIKVTPIHIGPFGQDNPRYEYMISHKLNGKLIQWSASVYAHCPYDAYDNRPKAIKTAEKRAIEAAKSSLDTVEVEVEVATEDLNIYYL
jgi:hypothetical protein